MKFKNWNLKFEINLNKLCAKASIFIFSPFFHFFRHFFIFSENSWNLAFKDLKQIPQGSPSNCVTILARKMFILYDGDSTFFDNSQQLLHMIELFSRVLFVLVCSRWYIFDLIRCVSFKFICWLNDINWWQALFR